MPTTAPPSPTDADRPARKRGKARPRGCARFRLRITAGDVIAIGPGKIALLEAVEQTGSITAAAKSLGMSYRRAWLLLDELNQALKRPAVDSAKGGPHGGGSALTDVGRRMVQLYRRVEETAARASERDLDALLGMLAD